MLGLFKPGPFGERQLSVCGGGCRLFADAELQAVSPGRVRTASRRSGPLPNLDAVVVRGKHMTHCSQMPVKSLATVARRRPTCSTRAGPQELQKASCGDTRGHLTSHRWAVAKYPSKGRPAPNEP
jgi:hypothetical protein